MYIIHGPVSAVAAQLAMLLQISHPETAREIHASGSPRDRLHDTRAYVDAIAGSPCDKTRLTGSVDQKNLQDPQLQLWTAASIFAAVVKVQDAFFGGFTKRDLDHVYAETSWLATSLGVPPESWPATVEDFWRFWDGRMDSLLAPSDEARIIAEEVLYPQHVAFWVLLVAFLLRVSMTYLVPDRVRNAFGLQVTALNWVMYRLIVALIFGVYALLSLLPHHLPYRYYMDDQSARRKSKVDGSFMVNYDE